MSINSTDTLKLNHTAMFAKIRAGLPIERQHTQNLLESKDDMLYAWDSEECCLLAMNWRLAAFEGCNAVKYQVNLCHGLAIYCVASYDWILRAISIFPIGIY